MSVRLGALYDALMHPSDAELATRAAEEVADYKSTIEDLKRRVDSLQWTVIWTGSVIVTLVLGFGFGNLWLSFNILSRLPR